MLTKDKDVKPKKDVKDFSKNVFLSVAYSDFLSVGSISFDIFTIVFFFGRFFLKHIENKKGGGDSGACSSGKFLKIYLL